MDTERHAAALSAKQLFRRGGYAVAAKGGVAAAQFNPGFLYGTVRGVVQDFELAAKWYARAAEQNEPTAHANFGTLYARGAGVTPSSEQAVRLWRQAAELEEPTGGFNLGVFYVGGHGGTVDFGRAHYWLERARRLGHPDAARRKRKIEPVMTEDERALSERRLATLIDMTRDA
jgi:TPR repeat protein